MEQFNPVRRRKTAAIIGAGVCGPVAAMALQRAGIDATVYEAHPPATDEVGSYLTVAANGLDALAAIGADAPVAAAGFPTPAIVLSSGTGMRLGTVSMTGTRRGTPVTRTIKRAHLHRALHDEAVRRGLRIEFGKRLSHAESDGRAVVAHFADGSAAAADWLIGCDGIHSVTRRLIDPAAPTPRYVGLLNFGGETPGMTPAPPGEWHMIFGKRAFFGYATPPSGGTLWFANVPRHPASRQERESTTTRQWTERLVDLFKDDRGPAAGLIAAGRIELAADNTHDLPSVPVWHRGRMIIIGDAAHAPSPSSGQGASMAIEDAVVLAQCLRDVAEPSRAFAAFEEQRRRRVERIVAYGARSSSNKTAGPVGRVVRDLLLPLVFRHLVTEKSTAWMHDHHIEWDGRAADEQAAS